MAIPHRDDPGPGQESVWDFPRPPRLEPSGRRVQVWFDSMLIADTTRALRVLETYHPPTWYLPPEDTSTGALHAVDGSSFCEWKGQASYYDVVTTSSRARRAAWAYFDPTPSFRSLATYVAFYPALVECFVDGHRVVPQPGGFYAGWVTPDVAGPFKGSAGMDGW